MSCDVCDGGFRLLFKGGSSMLAIQMCNRVSQFAPLRSAILQRVQQTQVTARGNRPPRLRAQPSPSSGVCAGATLQASEEKAMANSSSHADAAADGTTEFAFKAT